MLNKSVKIKILIIVAAALSLVAVYSLLYEPSIESVIKQIEAADGFVIQDEDGHVIYVNLSSCELSPSLLKGLKSFTHLRYLYLDYSTLTDRHLKYIDKIRSLEILSIDSTRTTDKGICSLTSLESLEELIMSHYWLTRPRSEDFLKTALLQMVDDKQQTNIKQFYGEGMLALCKKYPALKVELCGGELKK